MKFTVKKTDFLNFILTPASKLADNLTLTLQKTDDDSIKTIKSLIVSANSLICKAETKCNASEETNLIIPDCKSFARLVTSISDDIVNFEVTENCLIFLNKDFNFKYYLLDESYTSTKKSLSEEKINNLEFHTNFKLSKAKFSEIVKYNSILPDAEKIYFFTDTKSVFIKLGDEQRTNLNELTLQISQEFSGQALTEKIPIGIENLLLFSFVEDEFLVSVNHALKILKFQSNNLSYIISGLVK